MHKSLLSLMKLEVVHHVLAGMAAVIGLWIIVLQVTISDGPACRIVNNCSSRTFDGNPFICKFSESFINKLQEIGPTFNMYKTDETSPLIRSYALVYSKGEKRNIEKVVIELQPLDKSLSCIMHSSQRPYGIRIGLFKDPIVVDFPLPPPSVGIVLDCQGVQDWLFSSKTDVVRLNRTTFICSGCMHTSGCTFFNDCMEEDANMSVPCLYM